MLNKVEIYGRLTSDPEVRYTRDGKAIASFNIAVQKNRDEADFFPVTAYERTAELIEKYLAKGRSIIIVGKLVQDKWTTKEGQNRSRTSIVAEDITFVTASQSSQNGSGEAKASQANNSTPKETKANEGFMDIPDGVDDEGLPFN